jgi:hypothetical protein
MPENGAPIPPPSESPHGDFPLPRNWGQAWPIILWGMLALAFTFVIAESLMAIIVAPLARAFTAFVALLCLTAIIIYRGWFLEKFKNPNKGLVVGILCTSL